jgi:hypothetical protein
VQIESSASGRAPRLTQSAGCGECRLCCKLLYIAGTQVINYSGSLCTDSATQLNQADFGQISSTQYNGWSEIIIANASTLGTALWTLAPQASGSTQSWRPNTVGNSNPSTINDSNSVGTTTSNALSEWTTPTSAPAGTWAVLGIVQAARVAVGTSGPSTFEWLMRTKDGTNHVTGSVSPSTSLSNFPNQIWSTNPFTSTQFVLGDIASGFNLGIESTP